VTRFFFYLFFVIFFQVAVSQTTPQNASPFQRLEFRCANDISLTHVVATPGQITLIFNDAFYPMRQVGATQDSDQSVRYEDGKNLVWMTEDGVGRLEQKDGPVIAKNCIYQQPALAYICIEDVTLEVQYVGDVAHIDVFDPLYGDQRFELPKVVSSSSAKFSDGVTTWFVKGEEGNLFEETEEVQHAQKCKLQND
jgi:membrane-bound inhibitor of C-type lysozyme